MKDAYILIATILFTVFSTLSLSAEDVDTIKTPSPYVNYGKIIRFSVFPSAFVKSRTIDVWLPNNYTPRQQYAVIYMQDGQMLFDETLTWNHQEWGMDETMQILQDSLKPVIIVGIWNADSLRNAEYYPEKSLHYLSDEIRKDIISNELKGKPLADNYAQFIVTELKPFIESAFSASRKPEDNFLIGSSMGGLISLYILCEYPNIFGGVGCLSTHWIGSKRYSGNEIPQSFTTYLEEHSPIASAGKRFYFDYGSIGLDSLYKPYQELVDGVFYRKGFSKDNYRSLEFDGEDHNEEAWRNRLEIPLLFLLTKQISN